MTLLFPPSWNSFLTFSDICDLSLMCCTSPFAELFSKRFLNGEIEQSVSHTWLSLLLAFGHLPLSTPLLYLPWHSFIAHCYYLQPQSVFESWNSANQPGGLHKWINRGINWSCYIFSCRVNSRFGPQPSSLVSKTSDCTLLIHDHDLQYSMLLYKILRQSYPTYTAWELLTFSSDIRTLFRLHSCLTILL